MDEIPEYQYSRVERPFIRVLHLSSTDACIGESKLLQGTLKVTRLEYPGSFDAISYAYGDPKCTDRILIDKKIIKITKNCHDGLRYLRDKLKVNSIWVDSISINAKDKAEKSEQIPFMTKIYGTARRVYIWLGEPTEASNRALCWLNDVSVSDFALLSVRIGQYPKNMHPREIAKFMSIIPDVVRAYMRRLSFTKEPLQCDVEDLQDIVGRSWFTRMWTVQEAAMASEAWVVCGDRQVRWGRFFWGLVKAYETNPINGPLVAIDPVILVYQFWLNVSQISEFRESAHRRWLNRGSWFYRRCFGEDSRAYDMWQTFLDFMELYGTRIIYIQLAFAMSETIILLLQGFRPLESIPLATLLWSSVIVLLLTPPKSNPHWDRLLRTWFIDVLHRIRIQQATEAKDKVYALYGLLEQLEIPLLAPPNYSPNHSLEDAYRSFTVSIINWHRSLDILLEASGPWGTDAPSWVPDWSRSYRRVQFSKQEMETSTAQTQDSFSFSNDRRQLRVSGKHVGVVISRMESLECGENGSISPLQANANAMILSVWVEKVIEMYHLSEDDLSTFLVSVFAHETIYAPVDFNKWIRLVLNNKPEIMGYDISSMDPNRATNIPSWAQNSSRLSTAMKRQALPEFTGNETVGQLHRHICSTLAGGMTVFEVGSKDGKFYGLGIGPDHMQTYDTVVRFATPAVPMIVRALDSCQGQYHSVGATRLSWMPWFPEGSSQEEQEWHETFTLV